VEIWRYTLHQTWLGGERRLSVQYMCTVATSIQQTAVEDREAKAKVSVLYCLHLSSVSRSYVDNDSAQRSSAPPRTHDSIQYEAMQYEAILCEAIQFNM
jgi:hypothetical protein